jgi:hypothetical protein
MVNGGGELVNVCDLKNADAKKIKRRQERVSAEKEAVSE